MARPRTTLGTYGALTAIPQVRAGGGRGWVTAEPGVKPVRWRARTKYRDEDGVLRDVERCAPTRARAEANLKRALADRQAPAAQGDMRSDMSVSDAAEVWLERRVRREDSGLAARTREQYEGNVSRYVAGSTIQGLTLREVNRVSVLERYLQGVADAHGSGAAKSARSVMSNLLSEAVRIGVLPHNACRDVRPAKASTKRATQRDTERSLTRDERAAFLAYVIDDERAEVMDLIDFCHFMAGTGVRISEAMHQQWADVDLGAGTVRVRGTKTAKSDRMLHMPAWLTDRLVVRAESGARDGLLFPSPRLTDNGKVRDQRNLQREMRRLLDGAGLRWATPHVFRRTVATDIDAAGLPIALAADVLGHADASMTARVYLGRRGDTRAAASVL